MLKKLKNIFSKSLKIPIYINTWNNRIIAREGSVFSKELMERVARMGKKFDTPMVSLEDTFFIRDFRKLLSTDMQKYGFISENLKFLNDLTNYVREVEVPEPVIKDLEWMKHNYSYNYHHIVAVSALTTRIARDFFLDDEDVVKALEAAVVYDLGMGRIPSKVVQKLGRLSVHERNIINYHPIYSALLIAFYYKDAKHPLIEPVINHHENLDGTGFPQGKKNDIILSHILKLSDTFDALISARPFRKYHSTVDAFKICEDLINKGKISPEILPIIYSYYLFIDQYPARKNK